MIFEQGMKGGWVSKSALGMLVCREMMAREGTEIVHVGVNRNRSSVPGGVQGAVKGREMDASNCFLSLLLLLKPARALFFLLSARLRK
jgi:hypothetical protein